jgi:hypothetical protein
MVRKARGGALGAAPQAVLCSAASVLGGSVMKHGIPGRGKSSRRSAIAAVAAGLLVLGAALPPRPAEALSAFAAAIPDDPAAQGLAFGAGYNYATRAGAEERALQECRSQAGTNANLVSLCRIVDHFDKKCLAISMDPQPGTPGYGWAIGLNADAANSQALANCRQTAGAARVGFCVISLTDCDTLTPAH